MFKLFKPKTPDEVLVEGFREAFQAMKNAADRVTKRGINIRLEAQEYSQASWVSPRNIKISYIKRFVRDEEY